MISYRFIGTDYLVKLDELPRSQLSGDLSFDFYWRNPKLISSLYCGDGAHSCERSFNGGFYRGDVGLSWASGVALGLRGENGLEVVEQGHRLLQDLNPVNQLIDRIFGQDQVITYPPAAVAGVFQSLYRRPSLSDLMESVRSGKLPQSIHTDALDLGIFGSRSGAKTLNSDGAEDLGKFGRMPLARKDFAAYRFAEPDIDILLTTSMPYWRSNEAGVYDQFMLIDDRDISRNIQVIDQIGSGDTVIWDRKPGLMRLALIWYDGVDIMPRDIQVEAGKTYHIHYTVRQPKTARWEVRETE